MTSTTAPAASRFKGLVEAASQQSDVVAEVATLDVTSAVPPWIETGIRLEPGDAFTALAEGEVVLLDEPRVSFGPALSLWFRVGKNGEIFKGTADTSTHTVRDAGPLYVAVGRIGWATRQGDTEGTDPGPPGGFRVALIAWKGNPARCLAALHAAIPDAPLLAREAERFASAPLRPQGWHYLWHVGDAQVYRDEDFGDRPGIRAETRSDAAILVKSLDLPLTESTRLEWAWRMNELPSQVAEDSVPTHDYMSIAVEFENGQDLTYYWSATLPDGHGFRCPLPWWDQRETHVVARSGTAGLGQWHHQRATLRPDYERFVGKPPRRIVGVWLISASAFSKSVGRTDYADVFIADSDRRVRVL